MTPEEFAKFVQDVIAEEVYTGPVCGCGCGQADIQGRDTAAARIAATVAQMFPPGSVEKCTRCGAHMPADMIQATGPYRACPTCTAIIRN